MGKVKIKRQSIWIDMTPMSDVMVLLLTFFMLTSTFVKNEAVKVVTPGSVSEVKVTDKNVLTILVDNKGKVFLGWDKPGDMETALSSMADQFGVSLTGAQMKNVRSATNIGVSMNDIGNFLNQESNQMNAYQQDKGIPTDSIDGGMSEFQLWVKTVTDANSDMKLAIKADEKTPYKVIKKVMSELQDMNQNRYELITSYKKVED
ncbi:ExbD/TolR family protein [Marseilla massiliensis]|jgi:biopolymer transport protein ExbD|uniref:Biopolymer transporter ExbD n=1 Tax=Marseilla massiliensis TaxID=1841864 RepID=A0A938WQH2_9BACT|nr:biopolymer transporter ExbD [Marseilla massiliensis]MBM6673292.1 biopolymer transporter ExbD [Marseilla massiliensis]CCY64977.1 biopolymer transporter ExbD/TolR family protein [Prevotella sp. CAG:1124]